MLTLYEATGRIPELSSRTWLQVERASFTGKLKDDAMNDLLRS